MTAISAAETESLTELGAARHNPSIMGSSQHSRFVRRHADAGGRTLPASTESYTRATRLLQELRVAHGDGSFSRRLGQLARLDLLVLDDLAIAPITAPERQDLLELLDDRVGDRSTLITSQLPTSAWHAWLAEPTIADAIMDRLLHGSHTIALKGESLRRAKPQA